MKSKSYKPGGGKIAALQQSARGVQSKSLGNGIPRYNPSLLFLPGRYIRYNRRRYPPDLTKTYQLAVDSRLVWWDTNDKTNVPPSVGLPSPLDG